MYSCTATSLQVQDNKTKTKVIVSAFSLIQILIKAAAVSIHGLIYKLMYNSRKNIPELRKISREKKKSYIFNSDFLRSTGCFF